MLPDPEQMTWLDANQNEIMKKICLVGGHSLANLYRRGRGIPYPMIVYNLARKLKVECQPTEPVETIESRIVLKVCQNIFSKLTAEQRQELIEKAEEDARRLGKSVKGELAGFATLGVGQLSGFGVYLLGSTVLGYVSTLLGLGLGFTAFATLSSYIALLIGPLGWSALGLGTILKLGAPNYKKLLPTVIVIAVYRHESSGLEGER